MKKNNVEKPMQDKKAVGTFYRDRRLDFILSAFRNPGRPVKYHILESGMSRGTYFKVKAQLLEEGVIVDGTDRGYFFLQVNRAREFIAREYPGLFRLVSEGGTVSDD